MPRGCFPAPNRSAVERVAVHADGRLVVDRRRCADVVEAVDLACERHVFFEFDVTGRAREVVARHRDLARLKQL